MTFPAVSLLDDLEREAGLGVKWTVIQSLLQAGICSAVEGKGYKSSDTFAAGEDGAYWNVTQFTNPAISFKINKDIGTEERFFSVYACMSTPTTAEKSGYKIQLLTDPVTAGKGKLVLQKIVKNVISTLATSASFAYVVGDLIGFTTNGTTVTLWHKVAAGAMTVVSETTDSSFNKGYIGIGSKGNLGRMAQFSAGSTVHEHTLAATQTQGPKVVRVVGRTATTTQSQLARVIRTATRNLSVAQSQGQQVLGLGSASTAYVVADQTSIGRQEGFKFTAPQTMTITELRFRTNGTANPGISSVVLGIAANGAGVPGAILGQGTYSGEPPINSWIVVTGLSIPVVDGTEYWLMELPIGTEGSQLHFNAAAAGGAGTANVESKTGTQYTKLEVSGTGYEAFNQGPVGFQALGSAAVLTAVFSRTGSFTTSQGQSIMRVAQPARSPSTTQAQSAVLRHPEVTRRLAVTQAQSPAVRHGLARVLILAQPQLASAVRALARSLAAGQPQAPTLTRGASSALVATQSQLAIERSIVGRVLSVAQPQQGVLARVLARSLAAGQGQAPVLKRAIAKTLTSTQPQAVVVVHGVARSLGVAQLQTPVLKRSLVKMLAVAQPQAATRATSASRAFSIAQLQGAKVTRTVSRALAATQTQIASVAHSGLIRTLTATQGQTPSVSTNASASRVLAAEQPQTLSLAPSPSRLLRAGQAQAATAVRALQRALTAEQGQSAAVARAVARVLSAIQPQEARYLQAVSRSPTVTQPQAPVVARAPARTLSVGQAQSTSVARAVAHILTAQQEGDARVTRQQTVTLALGQTQAASVTHPAITRILQASQGQVVKHLAILDRIFAVAQGQNASVTGAAHALTLFVGQPQHVAEVEAVITHREPPPPPPPSPSVTIGVVHTSFGIVEKAHRVIGAPGAPVMLAPR